MSEHVPPEAHPKRVALRLVVRREDMKTLTIALITVTIALAPGCKSKPVNSIAEQITPHLNNLHDTPTQQQMMSVIGECEKLREAHGQKAVAEAIMHIAKKNKELRDVALSLLSRYVSTEEYGDFVREIKSKN